MRLFIENLLRNKDEPLDINQPREFTGMGDMTPFLFEKASVRPIETLNDDEHVALRKGAHMYLSTLTNSVAFAKTHTANISISNMPLFHAETTRAAIYVVRNPLDVVDSLSDHWGLSIDETIEHMANPNQYGTNPIGSGANNASSMKGYLSSWSINAKSWTENAKFPVLMLKYEDMLEDPIKQFTRVVQFLGAPFNATQIERAAKFSSFKEVKKQETESGFAELSANSKDRKFFRHGKADRWKEVLTRSQAKRIIRNHKDTMLKLGYSVKLS